LAGGLEALQKLFGAMPPDSGLAFVVAAHLDPTQESHLTPLLSRCTKMPVVQITNLNISPDTGLVAFQGESENLAADGVIPLHRSLNLKAGYRGAR
jgi:two-component system CheB/CheR fusion protein